MNRIEVKQLKTCYDYQEDYWVIDGTPITSCLDYHKPDSLSAFGSLLGLLPVWSGGLIWQWENDFVWEMNAIARAMARQQTENIAFIIHEKQYPAILNPFYSAIVEADIQESTKRNYSLFIPSSQDMRLPNGPFYIKKHIDGVIFAGEANALVNENFRKQGIPVVLLNNYLEMEGLLCVMADHFNGAVTAMEHLYQRGHRRIGLLAG